ncbi:MAG TPA: hypothetical protein VFL31_03225 [Nitrospiraceae bacterium]|nr:hypothetical protein [Nitrospiraceae bacterium]
MGQINWNRVLLGGLVAGLVIDVVQWFLDGVFLALDWRQAMQMLGKPLVETPGGILFHILLGLVYGILAILAYASIRPRYGAGPITALYAGIGVWVLGFFLPALSWIDMGLFPRRLVAIATLGGLAGILVATLVGAWLYQEPGTGDARAARQAA